MTKLLLYTDGGSRGNPGPAAYGYVIYDLTNQPTHPDLGAGIILEKCGNYLGITTNNLAEYEALKAGVKWVLDNHPLAELAIRMDSLLIVNQIKGIFKVKNANLKPIYLEVISLLKQLPKYTIEHTYREGNSLADSLVNEALDLHQAQR